MLQHLCFTTKPNAQRKNPTYWSTLVCSLVVLIVGCNAKHTGTDASSRSQSNPELDAFVVDRVSYAIINKLVLNQYCLNCHSQNPNVKNKIESVEPWLDTFAQVQDNKSAIFHSVFEVKSGRKKMPRGNPMPDKAYQILKLWIEMGMPEDESFVSPEKPNPLPPPTGDKQIPTESVTWNIVKTNVLDKACNRCHKADNKWNAVNFNDPNEVISIYSTLLPTVLFSNSMPPREDPPTPLPDDWFEKETEDESPNPNLLNSEDKILLLKWFLNGLKI
jgi:uncharacterized membrane protein